jgi:PKD repeat protein
MKYLFLFLSVCLLSCQSEIEDPEPGPLPVADFIFQVQVNEGRKVNFASTSKDASFLIWDFGDNVGKGFSNSLTYEYLQNGTYTVKLTVGNKAGINTKEVTLTVQDENDPIPDFSIDFSSIGNLLQVGLTNTSQFGFSYLWKFGDGQTSTLANPGIHQYAASGTYEIELAATNEAGTVTRRKRIMVSVLDGTKISSTTGKTWKFRTAPYRVAQYPVNGSNPSQPYFVLRNGILAYESILQACELNDRYTFNNTTYINADGGDARVFESRNECKTIVTPSPSAFSINRSSLTSFTLNTGATYLGDLKASSDGFIYEVVELSDTILVVSYVRADQTNPALQERVVMVFEPE